jgi:hypothetical protein
VLLQASCATMAWLDAWAKLLLQQQYSLEQQLAKFTPVITAQGLVRGTPQRSDYGSPGVPVTPTGGNVSASSSDWLGYAGWGLCVHRMGDVRMLRAPRSGAARPTLAPLQPGPPDQPLPHCSTAELNTTSSLKAQRWSHQITDRLALCAVVCPYR